MRTNVPLLKSCLVTVTVSGLQGTQTPFGPLNLTLPGPFNKSASFEDFRLVQTLGEDTVAGTDYMWTFTLQVALSP